MPFSNIT